MRLAGVTVEGRGGTDRLLDAVADRLTRDGVRLVGALRAASPDAGSGSCDCDLWLLPNGPRWRITQDLGPGATACRMDAGAFEEAVGLAMSRLRAGRADLVILNKFGLSEAEGRGFRALISEALARGVPVLTGLSETHRAAFDRYADGMATILTPTEAAVTDWCNAAAGTVAEEGASP